MGLRVYSHENKLAVDLWVTPRIRDQLRKALLRQRKDGRVLSLSQTGEVRQEAVILGGQRVSC